ncbi:HalOD1 output domain-containing protein [Halobaculum magnesiiphilum]|uniref:Halobacterial output domain-containing protein n=1 Tax=Halobaculum magnesiiphilum TaxID=1017351 RepID=A0A8T8W9Z6_9EURY|nr:HalOD1 output domain-containing protein [Halobaculum magnesiiphilum]QZP36682.1 hypothetical protein K6T50_10215 [Halobaculum magnesiiphilum]
MGDSDTGGSGRGDGPSRCDRGASGRVVESIAAAEGTDPADIDARLYDVVDPEAIDRIVDHGSPDLTVAFRFNGYRVTVGGDGTVTVSDGDG